MALRLPSCVLHAENEAGNRVHELFDAQWQRELKKNPTQASSLGDRRYNTKWPDRSLEAIDNSHTADNEALADLRAIPHEELSAEDQLAASTGAASAPFHDTVLGSGR